MVVWEDTDIELTTVNLMDLVLSHDGPSLPVSPPLEGPQTPLLSGSENDGDPEESPYGDRSLVVGASLRTSTARSPYQWIKAADIVDFVSVFPNGQPRNSLRRN